MNHAPPRPLPANPRRADIAEDIDARILAAERRLVARQDRLRLGAQSWGRQLGEAANPRRFIRPAVIATGAVVTLMLLRRAPAAHAPAPTPTAPRPALLERLVAVPWPRLIGLLGSPVTGRLLSWLLPPVGDLPAPQARAEEEGGSRHPPRG